MQRRRLSTRPATRLRSGEMKIPATIRTDNMELKRAWEQLAKLVNYHLPETISSGSVTLPIQEADVENLLSDLAARVLRTDLARVAFSGNYSDLFGKPTIPTIPPSGSLNVHDEPLTDGNSNFIFAGGDCIVVVGIPNGTR
jgi:hypothetical protein